MSMFERVKSLDKKLALTIIFGVVTVVSLCLWFIEPNAELAFVSISETNVFDVHEELKDLTVLFQGENIEEGNLNLRILTLSVENTGQKTILQDHYARDTIWGIRVENGEVIETRLASSSSDYVRENVSPSVIGEGNIVEFGKIILEEEDFFVIEVLVLHDRNESPKVIPIGKIAGIREMEVVKSQISENDRSFVNRLVEGDTLVHFVRSISYIVILMVGVLALVGLAVGTSELVNIGKRRTRRKRINKLINKGDLKERDIHRALIGIYVKEGLESLKKIKALLDNKERLEQEAGRYVRFSKGLKRIPVGAQSERIVFLEGEDVYTTRGHYIPRRLEVVGGLINKDIVRIKSRNVVEVDGSFKKSLDRVLPHLEAREALELLDKE